MHISISSLLTDAFAGQVTTAPRPLASNTWPSANGAERSARMLEPPRLLVYEPPERRSLFTLMVRLISLYFLWKVLCHQPKTQALFLLDVPGSVQSRTGNGWASIDATGFWHGPRCPRGREHDVSS